VEILPAWRKSRLMISIYHLTIPIARQRRPLFDDVCLEINRGDFAEIIGPVGGGKSVLFSLLSLRKKAASAKSIIVGRNLDRLDARGIAELRQQIGSCAQQPKFLEDRSVVENLILPLVAREQKDDALGKVEALIGGSRLDALATVPARRLSAAERRLAAIFRALVGQPSLVVIDGGLEGLADLREDARAALNSAHDAGATVVLLGRELSPCDDRRTVIFRIQDAQIEPTSLEQTQTDQTQTGQTQTGQTQTDQTQTDQTSLEDASSATYDGSGPDQPGPDPSEQALTGQGVA
jgi:ABC-type ATPase involved in cell division